MFPLPRIDDLLDQSKSKMIFSEKESVEKTTSATFDALYKFRVMLMHCPLEFCNVYMDDITF